MYREITDFVEKTYRMTCHSITPIDGGWLNRLWRVSSDHGELLVKQYSRKRYSQTQLDFIESALQRQILLEKEGILCPHICQSGGRILHYREDTPYMVMRFCGGHRETPATVSIPQLESLGSACALMHMAFSRLPLENVRGFPIDCGGQLSSLRENYRTRRAQLTESDPPDYRKALLAQGPILEELSEDFFRRLPAGIAHEDFTPDNLLFHEKEVSAIIDFDRNQYSFLWHDIGRALLSLALEDTDKGVPGVLNMAKVRAFVAGYARHLPLTMADAADALRICWCIEVLWWIMPSCFVMDKCKATRYRDEILWLTEHWFNIDSLLMLNPSLPPPQ